MGIEAKGAHLRAGERELCAVYECNGNPNRQPSEPHRFFLTSSEVSVEAPPNFACPIHPGQSAVLEGTIDLAPFKETIVPTQAGIYIVSPEAVEALAIDGLPQGQPGA